MTFWWSTEISDFFFDNLNIKGVSGLILLCFVLGLCSIFFESMKVHDVKRKARVARERLRASSYAASETANLLVDNSLVNPPLNERICKVLVDLMFFLCHNILGYALMLAVMVYNGYLFVAVILGMGVGYFIFGHKTMKINMENIQARTNNAVCTARYNDSGMLLFIYNYNITKLFS